MTDKEWNDKVRRNQMAKELLVVPERILAEVIGVVRTGLESPYPVTEETKGNFWRLGVEMNPST